MPYPLKRTIAGGIVLTSALLACVFAYADDAVPVVTTPVADGIHLLVGRGGNVAISSGKDGVLVIDDQYASQSDVIHAAIEAISTSPIRFLLNTHWHSDHSGGNARMNEVGATLIAHDNVRTRLSTDQIIEFFDSPRPAAPNNALPTITFEREITFHFNDDRIRAFHVETAHTDGDTVVHFESANVIHTGDVFFNERYPFIDTGSGGSTGGVIRAVDAILQIADAETKIIPGHGPITDKDGLLTYRTMLKRVHSAVADLIVAGMTEEQVVLAKPTAGFDSAWGGGFLDPDTFVRMVYHDIKRNTLR